MIAAEDSDVYLYGLGVAIRSGSFTLTALALCLATGYINEVILFLLVLMPIRCCIGGYHASTPGKCWMLSLLIISMVIGLSRSFDLTALTPLMTVVSLGIVFGIGPVYHPNNPQPVERRIKLKKHAEVTSIIAGTTILLMNSYSPSAASVMSIAFMIACAGVPLAVLNRQTA